VVHGAGGARGAAGAVGGGGGRGPGVGLGGQVRLEGAALVLQRLAVQGVALGLLLLAVVQAVEDGGLQLVLDGHRRDGLVGLELRLEGALLVDEGLLLLAAAQALEAAPVERLVNRDISFLAFPKEGSHLLVDVGSGTQVRPKSRVLIWGRAPCISFLLLQCRESLALLERPDWFHGRFCRRKLGLEGCLFCCGFPLFFKLCVAEFGMLVERIGPF